MKKVTVLTLALGLLAGWGATRASGTARFITQPCTTTAPVGTRFSININLDSNSVSQDVMAWQYQLSWNIAVLRCDTIKEGTYLSQHGSTIFVMDTSSTPGTAVVGACLFYPNYATGNGTLARMVFYVKTTGSCALHFDPPYDNTFLLDTNIVNIPLTVKDGYFRSPSGIEEGENQGPRARNPEYRVAPSPFVSFAAIPGHEGECFTLYDVGGRRVGTFRGDRIGEGLALGVYFLRPEGRDGKTTRVVKVR